MDAGRALISKIIDKGNLTTALSAGIKIDQFEDQVSRRVFKWMVEYFNRYSETPTEDALADEFPTYRLVNVDEPYDYYVDRFRRIHKRAILIDTVVEANQALDDDDTTAAEAQLLKGMNRLGREASSLSDEDVIENRRARIARYRSARRNRGKLSGITTGFKKLDFVSNGFQPEQFVVFGGDKKQCKSYILMRCAIAAHDAGRSVLFLSFEMSVHEQLCRYDAMCCRINPSHLLHPELMTKLDERKLRHGLARRAEMPPFIISTDISATTTVSGLAGKIQQHQPDIIYVDGVYLMENEIGAQSGTAQAYTAISRNLKRLAQRTKKPLIVTTQALPNKMNKGVVGLNSLAWSSSWAQDADMILGVEKINLDSVTVRIVGGRNVSPTEVDLHVDWAHAQFEEVPDEGET